MKDDATKDATAWRSTSWGSLRRLDADSDRKGSKDSGLDSVSSDVSGFTVDDALNSAGLGKFQWLLMLYVGMAWFGDAMEMMLLSFLSPEVTSRSVELIWPQH